MYARVHIHARLYIKGPSIWLRARLRADRAYGYEDDVADYYRIPKKRNICHGSDDISGGKCNETEISRDPMKL